MKIFRILLFAGAIVIIIGQLTIIEFDNPEWKANSGSYLSIISMLMLMAFLIMSYIEEKRKNRKNQN